MTVYIVEDDRGVSDSLKLVIEQLGYDTVACESAEHLIARGAPTGADTVIVDLGLPGIGGDALIRWFNKFADPPKVVAISGQPQNAIRDMTRGLELRSLLRKPLSGEAIAAVL